MRVIIRPDYDFLCQWVSEYIIETLLRFGPTKNHPFVLGLPTGSTPLGVYQLLVKAYRDGRVSFKYVITFNMDEYVNLPKDHPQSYYQYMYCNFFSLIDIPTGNIHLLNGMAEDINAECEKYERDIESVGGIDLFLAGVGCDGHLAFNEPGSSLSSVTRVKTLCRETIIQNSRFFQDNVLSVPTMAITVGLKTIMSSKEVLVMVNGETKAMALKECLEGSVNHNWTVTVLQYHSKALVACDSSATSELRVKTVDYYSNLMKTTNMFGEANRNMMWNYIKTDDKIIVFSPHPDDDVIGLGATLQQLNSKNVLIVYMTDGNGGYDHTKYSYNPRKQEAILALKVLGYNRDNLTFLELPFYCHKRSVSNKDSQVITDILNEYQPNHIFVCQDSDPNKTHDRCYEVIRNASFNQSLRYVWLYDSAWGTNNPDINCSYLFDEVQFRLKVLSIKMHDSQDPPMITNGDTRSFYERIIEKNRSTLNPGYYQEDFIVIPVDKFQTNTYLRSY
jgi:glucosamine-6-phosphate deaminase